MAKSVRPFRNLGFFQNYGYHVNELAHQTKRTWTQFGEANNLERLNIVKSQTLKRLNIFDPFYDRFDVADEVLGATVVPFIIGTAGVASTFASIWEAGHMLAIKAGIAKNDGQAHGDRAVMFFLAGIALSIFSFLIFLKSAVSLVTRTIATMIDGKANSTEARFNDKDYFSEVVGEIGEAFIDVVDEDIHIAKHRI